MNGPVCLSKLTPAAAVWAYETSPLFSDAERAALSFAQCAAMVPNSVTDEHFAELRKHFSEVEIVEILSVVSIFGYFNRWNDSMATELEAGPKAAAEKHLKGMGWSIGRHAKDAAE